MELDGAVALVTGGSSGIGEATVALLREAGARVAVLDLQAAGGHGDLAIQCDVGDEDAVVAAVRSVTDELGPPDVAVLAAGVGGQSPILRMTSEEWDRVHRVNLRGVFLCLRETAKAMVAAGAARARSLRSGSVSGIVSDRSLVHYSTAKAAVHQLVRVAAAELGPRGIRVNAIAPGCTDTPMFRRSTPYPATASSSPNEPRSGVSAPPRHRRGDPGVGELDWVTGPVLTADGGITLRSPLDPA